MHLRASQPGRLLHLESRSWFLGLASRSVRITPDDVVIQRGWKRQQLPRSRVRRAWVEHVRAPTPRVFGSITLWLEVRDEPGARSVPVLEAFRVHYRGTEPISSGTVEQLLQALAEFDLRPSLTGDPLPEPASSLVTAPSTSAVVHDAAPNEPFVELRGLTVEQRALVRQQTALPPGARFYPAHPKPARNWDFFIIAGFFCFPVAGALFFSAIHYFLPIEAVPDMVASLVLSGMGAASLYFPFEFVWLRSKKKHALRELPGAGLYLLPDGVMRVAWGKPSVVVPATAVHKVERRQSASLRYEVELHYRDSAGHNQVLPLTGTRLLANEMEREVGAWLNELAAKAPSRARPLIKDGAMTGR
jgi:hypothetical protein